MSDAHSTAVPLSRWPLIRGEKTAAQITRDVCEPLERGPGKLWFLTIAVTATMLLGGAIAITDEIWTGIGTWGLNKTVGWAFDITNFVFWIGIGHAGTLISAILHLFRQKWRNSINRAAEAMTLFAVMCAGLYPLIHMGRPWFFYWIAPYPNNLGPFWVNFRSPLFWDFCAVNTYFTISLLFWYMGLLPDLGVAAQRAVPGLRKKILTTLSLGWDGAQSTWRHYELLYLLLAGLATPLVFSVHTVVSFDFATGIVPGWHSTIFPPYFVIGAIFSGFAMVLFLMIIARKVMHYEDYITIDHIEVMGKVTLFTGSVILLAYATEFFMAWYGGNLYERFAFINRVLGPYWGCGWVMIACNCFIPQLLWFRSVRRNVVAAFIIAILINVGMWLERFVIIMVSLHRDFLTSSWSHYTPTYIEWLTLLGDFGLFFTLFLIFCRFVPMIAISEVKAIVGKSPKAPSYDEVAGETSHG